MKCNPITVFPQPDEPMTSVAEPGQSPRTRYVPSRRLASGQPRLDAILGGGLIDPSIALIAGLPGTGKTVLAQQYAFANGTDQRPAMYLSTVAEPLAKILYFAEGLSFFDGGRVGHSVLFDDLGDQFDAEGLAGVLTKITSLVERTHCWVLIIDSFRALRYRTPNVGEFEDFIHNLAGRLTATGTTALWLGEYGQHELASRPEFAIADAAIVLASEESGQRESRAVRVLKVRGSDFRSGAHAYWISAEGVEVFPRLSDVDDTRYEVDLSTHDQLAAALEEATRPGRDLASSSCRAGRSC
jgi:circadian clock protein KaiC